jgi:hypothetical protein
MDGRAVPLRYARGNVLFGRSGEVASLYRLPEISYVLLPDEDKWSWLWTMARLALHAKADFSIWRVQRRYPAEEYMAQAESLVDARYQDPASWRRFLDGHERHLAQLETHLPEIYMRLAQRAPGRPGRGLLRSIDRTYRRVNDLFGLGFAEPIPHREIDALAEEETRLLERVRTVLPAAERATTRELQWLLRRASVRHVAEPQLDPWWRPNAMIIDTAEGPAFEPRAADFLRHCNAPIHREDDHLIVRGEEARTYQAFLTLGALPDEAEFPSAQAELLFAPLEAVDFPVDAVMHCRWIANRKALAEVQKALIDANNAIRDARAGAQQPDEVKLLNRELGRELEAYLKSEARPPLLEATISFAIGAPDLRELKRRTGALREYFAGVTLHQPAGLQEQLYYDHLPRPGGGEVLDYYEMMTLEQFGALMPIATRKVGNLRGVYVGHTLAGGRARSPVKLDLTAPAADHLPTSIFMGGRQGSGKTAGAQIAAFVAGAMRGSYVLTADPKPDHNIVHLPELEGNARIIGLEADERYRGMLDPLVVSPQQGGLREEIAISYFMEVLPEGSERGAWETEIIYAVRDVLRDGGGSLAVLDRLRAGNDAAQDAARRLHPISDSGLGILAFGDGTNGRGFSEIERVTTITMAGVDLPAAEVPRDHYSRADRLSVATFKLVASYIMWLVTQDPSVHKVVILDEAWTFLGTQQGRSLLDKLVRLGRRFNCTVIIASQTIVELGDLDDLIGMRFIFGQNSRAEAKRALALVGADPEDESLVHALIDKNRFCRGRCLLRDLDGNLAEIQIDAVYPHILDVLDTSPTAVRREAQPTA